MDNQQAFDTALNHLRKQGRAAVKINEYRGVRECMYRGSDGTMCAIGCMIPDSMYDPTMENCTPKMLSEQFPRTYDALFSGVSQQLLHSLQFAHDEYLSYGSMNRWEAQMAIIAGLYSLTYTPPEAAQLCSTAIENAKASSLGQAGAASSVAAASPSASTGMDARTATNTTADSNPVEA